MSATWLTFDFDNGVYGLDPLEVAAIDLTEKRYSRTSGDPDPRGHDRRMEGRIIFRSGAILDVVLLPEHYSVLRAALAPFQEDSA